MDGDKTEESGAEQDTILRNRYSKGTVLMTKARKQARDRRQRRGQRREATTAESRASARAFASVFTPWKDQLPGPKHPQNGWYRY
ncbi:hypothetical protein D0T11_14945 [Hymenobacter rubripertinctus]|uniref:Uncharacterized protein n=1 Tax=Hymenobacter rubripertinctus TaxID=2029981 RepID=A0A418QSV0_9BACT|nr:hypothetical protein D0T11_14945 [Hymenobacter rubripertinctus]